MLNAQAGGAVAAVVVDDERRTCDRAFDERCVAGGVKANEEGFAAQDRPHAWEDVRIPVLLVRRDDGEEISRALRAHGGLESGAREREEL